MGPKALAGGAGKGYTESMKKTLYALLGLALLGPALRAAPYSHLEDLRPNGKRLFLVNRLLDSRTISYCVEMPEEETDFLDRTQARAMIEVALREWTHGIALRIAAAGRADEFKDILPVLDAPLRLVAQPQCNKAALPLWKDFYASAPSAPSVDLMFVFSTPYCSSTGAHATSYYAINGQEPFICSLRRYESPVRTPSEQDYFPPMAKVENQAELQRQGAALFAQAKAGKYDGALQKKVWAVNYIFSYDDATYFSIAVHEIGHAFGLADEYLEERAGEYKSLQPGEGIMRRAYQEIGCDEIDGMITLIDRARGTQRKFKSFCPNRGLICGGKEVPPPAAPLQNALQKELSHLIK